MAATSKALPDAAWLASADAVLLEQEVDLASAGIRALPKDDPRPALDGVTNVLRRVLENGSELDPLPPVRARPLVLAALVFVRKNRDAVVALGEESGLYAALRRLHRRKEDFGNPALIKNIDELTESLGLREPHIAPAEATAVDSRPSEVEVGPPSARSNPLDEWLSERAGLDAGVRAQGDVRFLSAYSGRPIPTSFAEALHGDDDIWTQPTVARWLDDRGEPMDAASEGVASAALLNARIREVRPRFFLRSPSSLVVQPIANSAEMEKLRNEVRSDFVVRALGTVFDARAVLETERRRGSKATVRKGEVLKVSDTLMALFTRLGYEERPEVGDTVQFDPVAHQGPADLESQEPVIVRRPGLWDLTDQRFVIKPVVDRTPEESPNNQQTDGASDVSGGVA